MLKAVLVVKGKNPEVIEVKSVYDEYCKVLQDNLSDKEREVCPIVDGVDFFGIGMSGISGIVEEFSACHPYERNRNWHGPALFIERDQEGEVVSMSEKNIEDLMDMFDLDNVIKSPSQKINDFIKVYTPEPEIFTVEINGHVGTLNTLDYIDHILAEKDPEQIKYLEEVMEDMALRKLLQDIPVKTQFSKFLKAVGKEIFRIQTEEFEELYF